MDKRKKERGICVFLASLLVLVTSCIPRNRELEAALSEGAYLVDVRTLEEFQQGSAKNAVNIPLNIVEQRVAQLRKKTKVVVFCRSGNRSGQAKGILEKHGHTQVVNGGSWKAVVAAQKRQEREKEKSKDHSVN